MNHKEKLGLRVLVSSAKDIEEAVWHNPKAKYGGGVMRVHYLSEHPFGLSFPIPVTWPLKGIEYVGYHGYTDSIFLMAAHIAQAIYNSVEGGEVKYLRIISIPMDEDDSHSRRFFYEVMIGDRIFMAGGANGSSGAGGHGKNEMDALFALLAFLHKLPVVDEKLDFASFQKAKEIFKEAGSH